MLPLELTAFGLEKQLGWTSELGHKSIVKLLSLYTSLSCVSVASSQMPSLYLLQVQDFHIGNTIVHLQVQNFGFHYHHYSWKLDQLVYSWLMLHQSSEIQSNFFFPSMIFIKFPQTNAKKIVQPQQNNERWMILLFDDCCSFSSSNWSMFINLVIVMLVYSCNSLSLYLYLDFWPYYTVLSLSQLRENNLIRR